MFQLGLTAVLSAAGHTVDTPDDVLDWVRRSGASVVLLTVRSEPDWALLSRLCDVAAEHKVIAVLDGASALAGARAVWAGAASVLPRDVTVERLRRTVAATTDGQAVMPAEVLTALARESVAGSRVPSSAQLSWLRQLAAGTTVEQLADGAGYSERAMYRLLKALYREMGVRTRLEAIMRAQDLGWL